MTKVSIDDVKKLAKLSQFSITDDEAANLQKELEAVLNYVAQLEDVDTKDVKPTSQVTGLVNVMREDKEVDYHVSQEGLLKNVPATQDGYIKVKRVLQ